MHRRLASALVLAACHPVEPAPPRCDLAVVIASQADVVKIASCTSVAQLTVRTAATVDLAPLAHLQSIAGDLRVGPTLSLGELSLPALRTIGGALHLSANGTLRGVFLPQLDTARQVDVVGNVELANLSLPRLAHVGPIVVSDAGDLEILDVTALPPTADITVIGAPKLRVIEAPSELVDRLAAAQSPR